MAAPSPSDTAALVWFRRDLRDADHAALHAALAAHARVHCVFVFDTEILDGIRPRSNRRVTFLWECVRALRDSLEARGGGLHLPHGRATEVIPALASRLGVAAVYANRDYEPAALARDRQVAEALARHGIDFRTRKDQVIFELDEIRTQGGTPYSVFTPYKRAWLAKLEPRHVAPQEIDPRPGQLQAADDPLPVLEALGFARVAQTRRRIKQAMISHCFDGRSTLGM